jgi:hypothetical protein
MCVYSVVADDWSRRIPYQFPWVPAVPTPNTTPIFPPTRKEFEQLREEVRALRPLLEAAKEYDERTGQPDCEMEEKIALIRRLAELVEVDLNDVLPESGA